MNCEIISPEKKERFRDVLSISLPSEHGQIEILPGHVESFVVFNEGEIKVGNTKLKVTGGICHVINDDVRIVM